jgi:hypothetical protein
MFNSDIASTLRDANLDISIQVGHITSNRKYLFQRAISKQYVLYLNL